MIKLLITEPRDIALAIRVSHDLSNSHDESDLNDVLPESSWSDIEEMFEEVGMEVVDESAPLDDDDDRRELISKNPVAQWELIPH